MSATTTTPTARELEAAFTRHYETRLARAGAITPGQKLAVIDDLERELLTEGRVPLASGPVRVPDVNHPIVKAALEGRSVVLSGKRVTAPQAGLMGRIQGLPVAGKVAVLVGIVLLPMVLVVLAVSARGQRSEPAVAVVLVTETATVTPTIVPSPTVGPMIPSATPLPEPTATPYALALTTGDAADASNDPASIEIAGYSYVLGVGRVENGEWNPQAAEWLAETDLHRVIAVPWEPNLANAVATLRSGNLITVRLRSGELAKYKISAVARVQRQQIEVLTGRSPGLSVVLYGEPSGERTVIVATAIQSPPDLNTYTATLPQPVPSAEAVNAGSTPIASPIASPSVPAVITEVPSIQTVLVTQTLTVTHSSTGLELSVIGCDRVSEVQQQPAPSGEEYLICDVNLRNVGAQTARYSDQAFGLTERAWWEARLDWMPPTTVSVPDALGAGELAPSGSTRGRLVGLVARPRGLNGTKSDAVLLWVQWGTRYVVSLPSAE